MESVLTTLAAYGVRIAIVLVVLWLAAKLSSWLKGQIETQLERRGFDLTLARFLGSTVRYAILIMTTLACLGVFGIQTTSFAAVIGAASLAIGLAFQGTLSDVASGVLLVAFRPFAAGDWVDIAGVDGIVEQIGLFHTTLDTADNLRIIIPNRQVTAGRIKNITHHGLRRVDIKVGTEYPADLGRVREVLQAAADGVQSRSQDKAPEIFLEGLGSSSIDWQVRLWSKPQPASYWAVWQEGTQAAKQALDAAGIGIPFPQMDVHMDGRGSGKAS